MQNILDILQENLKIFDSFLQKTYFDISVQNYLIAFCIVFGFYLLRTPFSLIVLGTLKKLASKTKTNVDDKIVKILQQPFRFSFVIMGFYFAKEWLPLETKGGIIDKLISSLAVFVLFWIFYRIVSEFNSLVSAFSSKIGKPLNEDIENFIVKTLKVLLIVFGILMFIQAWGVNITAFIASLGLGGLAFALAAKDTAANLFGSLVIFTDRPFQLRDWVEIDGQEGVVEEIGIRSTKLRTFPQAIATIPNATVANTSIVNWSRMGRRRAQGHIGLSYNTTSAQIEAIIEDFKKAIDGHEHIHTDGILLYFDNFGDSSLNIFYRYFTRTTMWSKFLEIKQEINIEFMHIVEKHGSSFAFPSQSLYIESMPKQLPIRKEIL